MRIAEQVLQAAAEPPHRNGGSISHLRHRCGGDVVRGVLRVKETCEAPLEGEASLQVVRRCRRRERGNEGLHHPAPRRFDHLPKQAARVVMRPFARSSLSNLPEAVGDKRPPGDPAVRGDETLTASGLRGRGMAIGSVAMGESREKGGGGGDGGWAETRRRRHEWRTPPPPDCWTARLKLPPPCCKNGLPYLTQGGLP